MGVTVLESVRNPAGGSDCIERRAYNVEDPPFWLLSRICERQFLVLALIKNSVKQSTLATLLRRWNKLCETIEAVGGQVVVICESERRDVLALYHTHKLNLCVVVDNTANHNVRQSWATYDNFLAQAPSQPGIPVSQLLGSLGNGRLEISGAHAGVIAVTRDGDIMHSCAQRSKFGRTNNTAKKFVETSWNAINKWREEHKQDLDRNNQVENHNDMDMSSTISNVRQKIEIFENKNKQEIATTPRKKQSIGRTKSKQPQSKNVLVELLGQSTQLERILANNQSRGILRAFLAKEHNSELIDFLEDLQELTPSNAVSLSPNLYKVYIATNARKQLNLSGTMTTEVEDALKREDAHVLLQMFSCVAMEVLKTLREDVFRRFIMTDAFQEAVQVLEQPSLTS